MASGTAPPQPPRWHPFSDAHHAQITVEEHDVDGEPHTDRVDASQRVGQEQPRVLVKTRTAEQTPSTPDAERRRDVDLRHEHLPGLCIDEFEHGAIVMRLGRPRARRSVADRDATRTHCTACVPECRPLLPLRYAPRMLCEDFHSGDDVTLGFLGRTYSFARKDFDQRVVRAAVDLELVTKPISRAEREDLVTAALYGGVESPRSDAGERICELQQRDGEDPVYWLRKLVFRSAWLDHRIKHGQVDVAFDDSVGAFRIEPGKYPLPGSGHPSFAATEASA